MLAERKLKTSRPLYPPSTPLFIPPCVFQIQLVSGRDRFFKHFKKAALTENHSQKCVESCCLHPTQMLIPPYASLPKYKADQNTAKGRRTCSVVTLDPRTRRYLYVGFIKTHQQILLEDIMKD